MSKYVLKPFWAKFVNVFPLWMAPNAVTLSGFGFIVANLCTVLYYDPKLEGNNPRWTYFTYAIGLFLYQTFDACDGAHARRTSQSSPLGELFDHCIDALNTSLGVIVFCSVIGSGYSLLSMLIQFALLCNFYLSTWEHYHTHQLFLSEFSGPVEGILLTCISFMFTGIWGPEAVWHVPIKEVTIGKWTLMVESQHLVFVFCGIGLLYNLAASRKNVVDYYTEKHGASKVTDKQIRSAMYGVSPFFVYFAFLFAVGFFEPAFLSLPFMLEAGLTIAFVVGRIIVAHLTLQDYPSCNVPMYIPLAQILLRVLLVNGLGYDKGSAIFALTWFGCGLTLGIHAMFLTEVICEFTQFLDIYALTIKHPKIA